MAALGRAVTDTSDWYSALRKPSWQPPDWLFGPVWTTIYGLMVTAAVRGWRRAAPGGPRRLLVALFAANALANVLWSTLFFHEHRPDWALMEIGVLWSSVLTLLVVLGRRDVVGGALVAPYLAWVSFASFLNLTIVGLNAPFAPR